MSFEASQAQRGKVYGARCIVTGRPDPDPAHIVPRSLGGCDDPLCVVPLAREVHRDYDEGRLDLGPYLEPKYRAELAHALLHVGLERLRRQVGRRRYRDDFTQSVSAAEAYERQYGWREDLG